MQEKISYFLSCSMRCGEIVRLLQMVASHPELSEIGITINPKRSTFPPSQAATIQNGQALVNLKIPHEVNMPKFFGAFAEALNKK